MEQVNSACLNDPEFPLFSDGGGIAVNYTTDFVRGIGTVTDELDYVAFHCPEGYVFEGTKNTTHYALCYNWNYIYLFDLDALCVPIECPDPPNFLPETVAGEIVYDMVGSPPSYQDIAQYSCPEGYVFEIYQEYPDPDINFGLIEDEQSVINLTCASYGDWLPVTVPRCIKINCTDDPITVPMNDRGMNDWDGQNKSFQSVISYYCQKPGWGFPSNGQSEMINYCQADKTWNLTVIENCVCEFFPIYKIN